MFHISPRRLAGSIAAVAAMGFAVLATAIPASAATYPPAYISKTQYLTSSPNSGMLTSCTDVRKINLKNGNYNFWEFVGGTTMASNAGVIVPTSGDYYWSACLTPQDGTYEETAALSDLNGNLIASLDHVLVLATSGTWTWGSGLDLIQITGSAR